MGSCGQRTADRVAELQRELKFAEGYLKRHPMSQGRARGNLISAAAYLRGAKVNCSVNDVNRAAHLIRAARQIIARGTGVSPPRSRRPRR